MSSYTPRPWNDDERDTSDYISYHSGNGECEEHVPVYKIMKEYYDEERAKLYHIDKSDNYSNECDTFWEDLYDGWSTCSIYSDCSEYSDDNIHEISISPLISSDGENEEENENDNKEQNDDKMEETLTTQIKFYYI